MGRFGRFVFRISFFVLMFLLIKLCGVDIIDTTEFALISGEDFALLFTSDDENIDEKFQLMNHTVTRIGSIVEHSRGIQLHCKNGDVKPVLAKGYEHFKS